MTFSIGPQEHDKIKLARMVALGLVPGGGITGVGGMVAGKVADKVLDKVPVSDTVKGVAKGLVGGAPILVPPMMGR